MKLKLHNFRCYDDAEFDFGEEGLTLISGSSGKGKSTLMMAIEFALFGSGNKLQTYGKRSCSVELVIDDSFKIFRQKCPNRLVVNDSFEDDAGESIIKQRFGTSMLSCYIPQNMRKSFILMSPADRLEFMESLIVSSVDISEIKTKTKALIKRLCDEQNEAIGAAKALSTTLASITKPAKVDFPLKVGVGDTKEKAIEAEREKQKTLARDIVSTKEAITSLETELSQTRVLNATIEREQASIVQLKQQLQSLANSVIVYDESEHESIRTRLADVLRSKDFQSKRNAYEQTARQIEEMKQEELCTKTTALASICNPWEDMSKEESYENLKSWEEEVEKQRRYNAISSKITCLDELEAQSASVETRIKECDQTIEDIKRRIHIAQIGQNVHKCPQCKTHLKFSKNTLELASGVVEDVSETLEELQQSLISQTATKTKLSKTSRELIASLSEQKRLRKELEDIGEISEDPEAELENTKEYIRENEDVEKKQMEIKKSLNTFSSSIVLLEKKNKILYQDIEKMKVGDVSESLSEEELRTRLSNLDISKERASHVYDTTRQCDARLAECERILKTKKDVHYAMWKDIRDVSDIETDISSKKRILCGLEQQSVTLSKVFENIKKYKEYVVQYKQWKKINDNHLELVEKEKSLRHRYTSACVFKEKILEAESKAIANTIEVINTHAATFLECFFPEDPITIRLVPFKETKDSQKPQINLEIEYKGIDHDLSMLSGGEVSRVVLAFTLALSEIHNTPFVMLDESTGSLDQELTCSVIEGLKENFGNKLVLLVAHQVVQGSFDKVISL